MRVHPGTTSVSLVLLLLIEVVYFQFSTKFRRFGHRSRKYHMEFAAACDSIFSRYPLSTNKFLEISTTDTSLPEIVRNLRPLGIKLSTNWIWILVDDSHTDGLSVTWEPQDQTQTNAWNLIIANGEGPSKVVYRFTR